MKLNNNLFKIFDRKIFERSQKLKQFVFKIKMRIETHYSIDV